MCLEGNISENNEEREGFICILLCDADEIEQVDNPMYSNYCCENSK